MPNDTIVEPPYLAWTDVPFNAGDFTGFGAMTWTVAEGDVFRFKYIVIGKIMFIGFDIRTTTVGGTPTVQLEIAIPGGKVAVTGGVNTTFVWAINNGAVVTAFTTNSATKINIFKQNQTNWAASTNLTQITGQLFLEIQ